MANSCVFIRNDILNSAGATEAAVTILKLRRQLESFGKVIQVSELEGEFGGMVVAYEDPEAAAKAREAFESSNLGNVVEDENTLSDEVFYSHEQDPKLLRVPTAATIFPTVEDTSADSLSDTSQESIASDLGSWPVAPQGATPSKSSKPRFLKGLELDQICWDRFASRQEWRTSLQLRGLPKRLCENNAFEAFLAQQELLRDVAKVKITAKGGPRVGSAILHASSVDGVERLARFFHGCVLPGASMPVAVSFANQQVKGKAASKPVKLTEPQRVSTDGLGFTSSLDAGGSLSGLRPRPPPGLEAYARPATLGCLPAWNNEWN